jgi:hypothetical protein
MYQRSIDCEDVLEKLKQILKHNSDAIFLFLIRATLDCLLSINFRAIAQADYFKTIGTDIVLASFNFLVIKRIASSPDVTVKLLLSYVLGSAIGAGAGLWLSTHL